MDSVLVTTSSSRYVVRNYWVAKNGVDYQVQVEVPTPRMNSPMQVATVPLRPVRQGQNLMVRDVALVSTGSMPGEIDRVTMQRYISVIANVQGEDLGRAAKQVDAALERAGHPPKGVRVDIKGQIPQMRKMFRTLAIGLAIAVVVVIVMLTAYFESLRLALASIVAVPGVLGGVVHHPAVDAYHLEHRVVHGGDHVHRSLGVQLGDAGRLHRPRLVWRAHRRRGGEKSWGRAVESDPHDRLRHDHRHGADGAGNRTWQPDASPARPRRDRRTGDVHLRDAVDRAGVFRPDRWRPAGEVAFVVSRRSAEQILRRPAKGRSRPARSSNRVPGPIAEWTVMNNHSPARVRLAPYAAILLCLHASCCGCDKSSQAKGASDPPQTAAIRVHVAQPKQRTITRSIQVPGIIQAYEQTAVFTKMPATC